MIRRGLSRCSGISRRSRSIHLHSESIRYDLRLIADLRTSDLPGQVLGLVRDPLWNAQQACNRLLRVRLWVNHTVGSRWGRSLLAGDRLSCNHVADSRRAGNRSPDNPQADNRLADSRPGVLLRTSPAETGRGV